MTDQIDRERRFFFEITDEDKYPPAGTIRVWGRVHLADPLPGTYGVEMYDVDPTMWAQLEDGAEIYLNLPRKAQP